MTKSLQKLKQILGDRIQEDHPLGPLTTFKIGGPADLYYEARTADELLQAVSHARLLSVPVFMLGGGSNILISDKGVRGLVIRNLTKQILIKGIKSQKQGSIEKKTVFVEAESGVPINLLVRFTVDEGLSGLHMHLGLPGSVGGALYMNSKWTHPNGYVGDCVYQARIVTKTGEEKIVPQSYFHFAYDTSSLQTTDDIVISVVFALTAYDKDRLWAIANESIAHRKNTQPQGVFTAGCTFRNLSQSEAILASTPDGTMSAGRLLDHVGLKGTVVGGAMISPQHANFIVNTGKATAKDVIELIEIARAKVKEQFGITLTEEIERIGEF
ncbi:MAG: UDP-N-acetylmuramate dehydrogenase [Patescibacteria group bacterium]